MNNNVSKNARRRNKNKNKNKQPEGEMIMWMPGRNRVGAATIKTAVPINTTAAATLATASMSYNGFGYWAGKAQDVLRPFEWFRVTGLRIKATVVGGAASTAMVYISASRDSYANSNLINMLNDENVICVNSVLSPTINLPASYWKQRNQPWYEAVDITADPPTIKTAGHIEWYSPASTAYPDGTLVGYVMVEIDLEFHTIQ